MIEHSLHTIFFILIMLFLCDQKIFKIDSLYLISISFLATAIHCLCYKMEETPCNATVALLSKVLLVLKFLLYMSVLLRVDGKAEWDWSTTFWPYWCSFAIQGIMTIASFIIWVNTIINYLRDEATKKDSKNILA